jgi:hypothetical protein
LSIDVGFKNLGVFVHDPNQGKVLDWRALDLSLPCFQPEAIIEGLERALQPYLNLTEVIENKCLVIIEKQTQMLNVHRVGAVDLALRALLHGKGIPVKTADPKRVKAFFSIEESSYKKRKKAAVLKASELIDEWPSCQLSDQLRGQFNAAKKKDDMADALLQWIFFYSQGLLDE